MRLAVPFSAKGKAHATFRPPLPALAMASGHQLLQENLSHSTIDAM